MDIHEMDDLIQGSKENPDAVRVARDLGISVKEAEEVLFKDWYAKVAHAYDLDPDPDNPMHFYDYRAAYKAGAVPKTIPEDGLPHWPSQFKKLGHPNMIVDGMDTRTMTPWNPQTAERPDAASWPKRKR